MPRIGWKVGPRTVAGRPARPGTVGRGHVVIREFCREPDHKQVEASRITRVGFDAPKLASAWSETVGASLLATRDSREQARSHSGAMLVWANASGLAPRMFTIHKLLPLTAQKRKKLVSVIWRGSV